MKNSRSTAYISEVFSTYYHQGMNICNVHHIAFFTSRFGQCITGLCPLLLQGKEWGAERPCCKNMLRATESCQGKQEGPLDEIMLHSDEQF